MLGGGKKKKQSKVKQRQQIKRETRKQNRALKRDTRLSNNKKKQPVNIKQRSKVYSKTRKQYRALKRDARLKKLQEQFGLSNSLKSISNKLSEHLSESSEFKSASEKYSENGLRVKSIEENNMKLIDQVYSLKHGMYSPNILNKAEFEHILKNNEQYFDDFSSAAGNRMDYILYIYLTIIYPGICIPSIEQNKFLDGYFSNEYNSLFWCENIYTKPLSFDEEILGGGGGRPDCSAQTLQFGKIPMINDQIIEGCDFTKKFRKCLDEPITTKYSRFIVIFFSIYFDGGGHANALIYDKQEETLERYEPNGNLDSKLYSPDKLDFELQRVFTIITKKDISEENNTFFGSKYYSTWGIQLMENFNGSPDSLEFEEGYCFFWSALFIQYRINYPDISRKEIIPFIYRIARESLDKKNNFQPMVILYPEKDNEPRRPPKLGRTLSRSKPHYKSRYSRRDDIKKKLQYDFNSYMRSHVIFIYIIQGYLNDIISIYLDDSLESLTKRFIDGVTRMLKIIKETDSVGAAGRKRKKSKKRL